MYTSKNWEKNKLGEKMVVFSKVICDFWKPIYLVDELNKTAMHFMDNNEILQNVNDGDIDWDSLDGLKGIDQAKRHANNLTMNEQNGWLKGIDQAKRHSAYYPTHIRGFRNGVAEVEWQINPDGMYFMDEDGFGMSNDVEESLYGFIDHNGDVVVPFTYIGQDWERFKSMRREAERKNKC